VNISATSDSGYSRVPVPIEYKSKQLYRAPDVSLICTEQSMRRSNVCRGGLYSFKEVLPASQPASQPAGRLASMLGSTPHIHTLHSRELQKGFVD
jgi:hypothetical protein